MSERISTPNASHIAGMSIKNLRDVDVVGIRDMALDILDARARIAALEAENATLCEALDQIQKRNYGVDMNDSADQQATYWSRQCIRQREIAAAALKGEKA